MPNDFQRLDTALEDALALEPEARAGFVARFTVQFPALGARLEALLAAADTGGPLDELAADLDEAVNIEVAAGDRFGAYEVIETVGEGGMGRVYRARRADGEFEGEVAIKVIRAGVGRDSLLRRFAAERDILASIEHPAVARLRDAGTTPGGEPYLVMDFVRGRSILEHADASKLDVAARVDLVLEVCDAVAHAHDRLIVHRDLKPSNILVGADGRAVLLDFGIAKVRAAQPDPPDRTEPHERVFTPRWAAPEQLQGGFVGPGADIFSLGLLLYALLVGKNPRDADPGSFDAGELRLDTQVAPAVAESRSTTPRGLRRMVAGDLQSIVEKTLRSAPSERYLSVRALADDLRAYRTGRPVAARPGRGYRAARFVARHAALVVSSTLAVGLLIAYAVTVTLQSAALEAERDRARAQASRARASARFLDRMLLQGLPDRVVDGEVSVRALIERAETQLDVGDPSNADLLLLIARAYGSLGRDEQAMETALRARALADRAFGAGDERTLEALRVEVRAHANRMAYEDAQRVATTLVRRARAHHGSASAWSATALLVAAEAYDDTDPNRAAGLYAAASALFVVHEGPLSENLARAVVGLGFCIRDAHGMGAGIVRLGLAIQRRRFGEFDLRVSDTLHKLALVSPEPRARVSVLERALAIERHTAGPRHLWVANTLNDLALTVESLDAERSVALLTEASEIFAAHYEAGHPRRMTAAINLGAILREQGELERAEAVLGEAYQAAPTRSTTRATAAYHLALLRRRQHDDAAAVELLRVGLEEVRATPHPVPHVARIARELGDALAASGQPQQADAAWAEGIVALRGRDGAQDAAAMLRERRRALATDP